MAEIELIQALNLVLHLVASVPDRQVLLIVLRSLALGARVAHQ